jgi:Flp pilus assembly protein TadG
MNTTPSAPTLPLTEGSADPTGVADVTPEFSAIFNDADTGDTGNYYQIEVNTASDFTGTVMWDSTLLGMTPTAIGARSPDISYAGTALSTNGATYYWRIKFADNHGTVGPVSATAQFAMNTTPGNATLPLVEGSADTTRVDDLTPEFSGIFNDPDTGDTGNYYEINVNTASDFTGTVMWASGLQAMTPTAIGARSPDISYTGSALSASRAKYYWRIRFADNKGTVGGWSSTANFTMIGPSNVTFEKVTIEKMVVDPY